MHPAPAQPESATGEGGARPRYEVAEIFRSHGEAYRRCHRLSKVQHRAMRAIEQCRTAALGGHVEICDDCAHTRISYNSCRNRHCPKCQNLARAKWLDRQKALLLPVGYFHVVFTLPHELNPLVLQNHRILYTLLFQAASQTLQAFARDPKHLGAELGMTAVLHTWGQNLSQHVHIHCLVSAGGLSQDRKRWIPCRKGFLFPVRALSSVFRGKYLDLLQRAFQSGKLRLEGTLAKLGAAGAFGDLLRTLRAQPWVVFAKRPFAGPEQVLGYLGRYTHRVAISNNRLVALDGDLVRFHWKDYADGDRVKTMELGAAEFIRRFLLHVLPAGFMRIRHFGLLANRHRQQKLSRCRDLLRSESPEQIPPETLDDRMLRLTGVDIRRCPLCGQGRMTVSEILSPAAAARKTTPPVDTS